MFLRHLVHIAVLAFVLPLTAQHFVPARIVRARLVILDISVTNEPGCFVTDSGRPTSVFSRNKQTQTSGNCSLRGLTCLPGQRRARHQRPALSCRPGQSGDAVITLIVLDELNTGFSDERLPAWSASCPASPQFAAAYGCSRWTTLASALLPMPRRAVLLLSGAPLCRSRRAQRWQGLHPAAAMLRSTAVLRLQLAALQATDDGGCSVCVALWLEGVGG